MNTIPAQGAPGSLIRKFQENPELGIELLRSLELLYANTQDKDGRFSPFGMKEPLRLSRDILGKFSETSYLV